MIGMEITDDILRGFHPINHNYQKVKSSSGTCPESENCRQRIYCSSKRNIENGIIVEDMMEKRNNWKFLVLTPHTCMCFILCTLIFSFISPLGQSPLCAAAIITIILIFLDWVKTCDIYISVLTWKW